MDHLSTERDEPCSTLAYLIIFLNHAMRSGVKHILESKPYNLLFGQKDEFECFHDICLFAITCSSLWHLCHLLLRKYYRF